MSLHPETLRIVAFASGISFFFLMESLLHARPWRAPRSRRLAFHLLISVLNTVILRLTVAGPLLFLTQIASREGWGLAPRLHLSGVTEIVATVLVLDMGDYWWHRANHRIPLLWRFHQVHHVDTHVDVTTSLRFHPGELLISGLVKASWIILWGPSLLGFAIFEALITLTSQYHHSNVDFSERFEKVVRIFNVTPRMHTSHHSAATASVDANFSTIFSFWDRLFGSYVHPSPEHLQLQGLPYGRERDLELIESLCLPFRKLPEAPQMPPGSLTEDLRGEPGSEAGAPR